MENRPQLRDHAPFGGNAQNDWGGAMSVSDLESAAPFNFTRSIPDAAAFVRKFSDFFATPLDKFTASAV